MTHQITVNLDEHDELLKFFPEADMTHPTITPISFQNEHLEDLLDDIIIEDLLDGTNIEDLLDDTIIEDLPDQTTMKNACENIPNGGSEPVNDWFSPEGNHNGLSDEQFVLQDDPFNGDDFVGCSDEILLPKSHEENDLATTMSIFDPDRMAMEAVDLNYSAADRRMIIIKNPETPYHPRYATDGIRRAQKMRKNPVEIQLPRFICENIDPEIKVIIEIILATSENNPQRQKFMHVHKLGYLGGQALEINDQCLHVQLTESDLAAGVAKFPNLSITRQLQKDINYNLRQLSRSSPHGEFVRKYETPKWSKSQTASALAKDFIKDYDLLNSCLVFRLLFKRHEIVHRTDIECSTTLLREQEGKPRGSKRTHDDSEDEQLEVVTLNKTKRRRTDSPPSKLSLPVVYNKKQEQ